MDRQEIEHRINENSVSTENQIVTMATLSSLMIAKVVFMVPQVTTKSAS